MFYLFLQVQNSQMVLMLIKLLDIENVCSFKFMREPNTKSLNAAMWQLNSLGAIDEGGRLTSSGERMCALFPLADPRMARMLLAGEENMCVEQAVQMASMLTVTKSTDIFRRLQNNSNDREIIDRRRQVPICSFCLYLLQIKM